jgi:hypothetical protein
MPRGLNDTFMYALKEGKLKPFLDLVKRDNTLDLEIRENSINIYYRGGSIVKIEPEKDNNGEYKFTFDENYFDKNINKKPEKITENHFPQMKQAMDEYLTRKKRNIEKEFQQLIVRENNYSPIANFTDYYIADIEYAAADSRSDMIAIKWKSTGTDRKKTVSLELALIEVKYGDGALKDDSGIIEHLKKANKINIKSLQDEMKKCFNQKNNLCLIPKLKHNIKSFKNQPKVEFIFIFINHDPAKSSLEKEINKINPNDYPYLDIKFAVSNFMGYGLYENNIYPLETFKEKFKERIKENKNKHNK